MGYCVFEQWACLVEGKCWLRWGFIISVNAPSAGRDVAVRSIKFGGENTLRSETAKTTQLGWTFEEHCLYGANNNIIEIVFDNSHKIRLSTEES
jgi:hypothetical protein